MPIERSYADNPRTLEDEALRPDAPQPAPEDSEKPNQQPHKVETKPVIETRRTLEEWDKALRSDAPQPAPDDPDVAFALRHNPGNPFATARILRSVPKLRAWLETEFERMDFDPIFQISDFVAAVDEGRTPRPEDLRWFADVLKQWLATRGKVPFERIMGLAGERGKDTAIKQFELRCRDEELLSDVMSLCFVGATVEEACGMACARFELLNPEGFKEYGIKSGTLAQTYKSAPWAGKAAREVMFGEEKPSDEETAELLSQFPPLTVPERLRVYLRIKR
jgi:hypothetical protein